MALFLSVKSFSQQGTVTIHQDKRIPTLLDLKKSLEKDNKLTDGFTIQLYYGNLSKANSTLSSYRNKYGKWPASIEYETPNYKVWVGNFTSRIEADRVLLEVQRNFPSAFILKPGKNKKD
ncbi:SPOR domain-containing protein [Halomarinibacterium sedimenti]|uniref:SPOR domain-containing protein n=1 Tax=Halomarinibacterium sedimenti TaxID=2857106 RepID=UPI002106EAEC|nr:SPOR domain-containing protein [Halomarinibacterium sedimenti]